MPDSSGSVPMYFGKRVEHIRQSRKGGCHPGRAVRRPGVHEGGLVKRQHRLLVFGTALLLAGGLTSSPLAFAGGAGSTLVQDFSSSVPTVASDWQLPGANGTDDGNDACLVPFQGESATAPITDCADGDTSDEDFDYIGRSGLQLTPDVTWQEGGVAWGTSVPTSEGLDITFNSYQYPGTTPDQTPADGISFFLAASDPTDPTNSASAVTLGPPGADLGYSADPGDDEDGLTNAYLGVGLDVFGNFSNSGSDFTPGNDGNCSGVTTQSDVASQVPESLDVRGPGNGQSGYCLMNSTQVSNLDNGGVLDGLDSGGNPIAVPVEIVINPTSSTATTPSGFQVPAGQYLVDVTMTDGNQYQETGELPDATPYAGNNPNGWYDGDGVPKQLSFGWAASTGADREFHTISDLDVSSLGTPPQYSVTLADNSGGGLFNGQQVTYTATPTLSGASETRPITVTDTFPSTLTPPNPSMNPFTTNGWTCNTDTATGQTVTCTMSPPSGGQPPGQLNAVAIPVTVNAPPGNPPTSISDSVTVSSDDGQPATTTDSEPFSTATTLAFTNQPNNAQVNTGQDVKISAEIGSNGPVDTTYTGPVTLSIANNPSKARFVVGSGTASTLTVNAQKGVADFPNVALNAVGFGYTLGASAPNVSSATPSTSTRSRRPARPDRAARPAPSRAPFRGRAPS